MAQNFATKQLRLSGKFLTTDSAAELYIDGDRLLKADESGLFSESGHGHLGIDITFIDSGFSGYFSSSVPPSGDLSIVKFEDDVYYLYYSNGANVYQMPFSFIKDPSGVSVGNNKTTNKLGLDKTYITNKKILNSVIGGSDIEEPGSVKFENDQFYIYSETDASFVPVSMRFSSRQTGDSSYILEHLPLEFETYLDTRAFDSTSNMGSNGLPLVQDGISCIGATPPIPRVGGRII